MALDGMKTDVENSDLYRDIADPVRQERVGRVQDKINELGIKYIYYQYAIFVRSYQGFLN